MPSTPEIFVSSVYTKTTSLKEYALHRERGGEGIADLRLTRTSKDCWLPWEHVPFLTGADHDLHIYQNLRLQQRHFPGSEEA